MCDVTVISSGPNVIGTARMAGLEHSKRPRSHDTQKHSDVDQTERPQGSLARDSRSRRDEINTKNSRSTAISRYTPQLPFPSHDTEPTTDITDDTVGRHHLYSGLAAQREAGRYSSDFSDDSSLLLKRFPVTSIRLETTPVQKPRLGKHAPIPATVLFARDAAPLHLPKLDKYLSSFPPPRFSQVVDQEVPFPPMGNLAKLGMSLEDLETNRTQIPTWRNRNTVLGSAVNIILGLMGSSVLASSYSLQGLSNTVQIFALILSTLVPLGGRDLQNQWQKLFLGTIPNILALNFASTVAQPLIFLVIFMVIAAGLLSLFYHSIRDYDRYRTTEGLQAPNLNGGRWSLVIVTFLLTVIYLPLSTMAVHVLVWSQDLWVVANPYNRTASIPPVIPPLGPASEYRNPLDFCWTTTMKKNEVNYAPMIVIMSVVVVLFLTIWFPIALHNVIKKSVPKVDRYSELGRPRNNVEMDQEYRHLLDRDRNPFSFLYNGFRRNWGTYQSTYLGAKLSTLIIVVVIDANNCIFRSLSSSRLPIIRQVLLLVSTIGFFLSQCIIAPFIDPVNNASEWVSRLVYVTTSSVALAVAFDVPGKDVLNTYVLYVIYITTYSFTLYFTTIDWAITQRIVKRLTGRIDFSIDVFSPRLDITSSSLHTKRRIWQESITTLLLTTPECAIPKGQRMMFVEARDSEFPPYLLDFRGSPGERHVENLKILRDVGTAAYNKAVGLVSDRENALFERLEDRILNHFVGPDCYWKDPDTCSGPESNFFGNAWWIPFPPTLAIRYDSGPLAVLKHASEFEAYISQNNNWEVQRWRQVRLSLRALEGQKVVLPYEHVIPIGDRSTWGWARTLYRAKTSVHYAFCILRIQRQGHLVWQGVPLGSGFDVELCYTKEIILAGDAIGLNHGHDLTAALAQFLKTNQTLISERLRSVEETLSSYRRHYRQECRRKRDVLSYQFLYHVYDQPRSPGGLAESSIQAEHDPRVHRLMVDNKAIFETAYERLTRVTISEAATWWYIFWDDIWRRNHDTVRGLERHASDFNPHYPRSIAYTPLPRASMESFLAQRGLFSKNPRSTAFFTSGFLNKLYLRLNDAVFRASSRAVMFHIGDGPTELEMDQVDVETQGQSSTLLGTGGGTDHDASSIPPRPVYRWEGLLNDPPGKGKQGKRKMFAKLGAWLGLTPLWRSGLMSSGISLDVQLQNGRYVVIVDEDDESKWDSGINEP